MALPLIRIPGPAILGLGDIFVGAPPPKKKTTIVVRAKSPAPPSDLRWAKSPQKGRTFVSMVPQKGKTHEQSIQKAWQVADRAANIAKTASTLAKKTSSQIAKKTILGAIAPQKAAGAHLHAVRLAQAAREVADRAKKLGTHAKTHQGTVSTGKQKQAQAVKIQKAAYGPSGKPGVPVHLGGEVLGPERVGEVLDAYYGTVGAWPDPDQPGYLDDGSLDPIILVGEDGTLPPPDSGAAPPDLNAPPPDPAAAALDPADATYGLGPPPSTAPPFVAGQDYMPGSTYPLDAVLSFPPVVQGAAAAIGGSDPADPRSGLPPGAVLYDPKSKPWGWQAVGSYTRFFPSADKSDGHGPSGFQWGGGNRGIMDGWYWWYHGATSGTEYKHENAGNGLPVPAGTPGSEPGPRGVNVAVYGVGPQTMPQRAAVSSALGWGPLIGNPNDPDFKNLRYDTAGDRWFWFYDEAPAWAKALDPVVGDGVRLQKAILDYNTQVTAAKADALQAATQDKADQKEAAELARQQAKQDARAALQQRQVETQGQTQQTQQQQAEAAAQSQHKIAQMQQESQANALLLQQAQQQLAQAAQAPGGGYEDEGGYDDEGGQDEGGQDEGGYDEGGPDDSPRMDTSDFDGGADPDTTALGAAAAQVAGKRAVAAAARIQKGAPRLAAAVRAAGQKALSQAAAPVRPKPVHGSPRAPLRTRKGPVRAASRLGEDLTDTYGALADAAAHVADFVATIQAQIALIPASVTALRNRGQRILNEYQVLFGKQIEDALSGEVLPSSSTTAMLDTLQYVLDMFHQGQGPVAEWMANVKAYLRVHPAAQPAQSEGGQPTEGGSGGAPGEDGGGMAPAEDYGEAVPGEDGGPVSAPSRGAAALGWR